MIQKISLPILAVHTFVVLFCLLGSLKAETIKEQYSSIEKEMNESENYASALISLQALLDHKECIGITRINCLDVVIDAAKRSGNADLVEKSAREQIKLCPTLLPKDKKYAYIINDAYTDIADAAFFRKDYQYALNVLYEAEKADPPPNEYRRKDINRKKAGSHFILACRKMDAGDQAGATSELKTAKDLLAKELTYSSDERFRNTLYSFLKNMPHWGFPLRSDFKRYTKPEVFSAVNGKLPESEKSNFRYPFEVDDEMCDWATKHLSEIKGPREKAQYLFFLCKEPWGLKLRYLDDFYHYKDDVSWTARTSKEVFYEHHSGAVKCGNKKNSSYYKNSRTGDCASQARLYTALARSAGLDVAMVRIYQDIEGKTRKEHRGAGVIIDG
ncbi:hypothetical protein [Desulfobacula toluolica]|uniref:Transglutaminase-like domain-containing protein n=1 Tax=Desulfobacula toluolica (strain DSM 7467 / Tol2) TaxID=651182 RepID=K0NPV3_DESTT|nr:hypothetical protein [Desulfobacula toluolica]CCK82178.1 uncharacterized protein TOL2_C40230 [Desulfobacula toluolica Tol2]